MSPSKRGQWVSALSPPPNPLQGGYSIGPGLNAPLGSDARAFHDSPLVLVCLLTNELLCKSLVWPKKLVFDIQQANSGCQGDFGLTND